LILCRYCIFVVVAFFRQLLSRRPVLERSLLTINDDVKVDLKLCVVLGMNHSSGCQSIELYFSESNKTGTRETSMSTDCPSRANKQHLIMSVLVEMSWKTINQQKICIPTRHHYFLTRSTSTSQFSLLRYRFPKDFDLTMLRGENERGSTACHQDINNDTIFIHHFNQVTHTLYSSFPFQHRYHHQSSSSSSIGYDIIEI
jgi:hypothetical protein